MPTSKCVAVQTAREKASSSGDPIAVVRASKAVQTGRIQDQHVSGATDARNLCEQSAGYRESGVSPVVFPGLLDIRETWGPGGCIATKRYRGIPVEGQLGEERTSILQKGMSWSFVADTDQMK